MSRPRIVDAKGLAKYLGYVNDTAAMQKWVRSTLGVETVKGRRGHWDLNAIDAALDRISKIPGRERDSLDPYEAWKNGEVA
ncbi:MAG: hypothetical protein AAGM38_09915 [Pseudomonadota bacterium]